MLLTPILPLLWQAAVNYHNVYRVVRPDGTIRNLEEFGYIDRASDGKPMRLTGMSIDITERVTAQPTNEFK